MMTNPNQIHTTTTIIPRTDITFHSNAIASYDLEVIEVTGKKRSQHVSPKWFVSKRTAMEYLNTLTSGTMWHSQATTINGYVYTGNRRFMAGK